jgi:hypothetical protein
LRDNDLKHFEQLLKEKKAVEDENVDKQRVINDKD